MPGRPAALSGVERPLAPDRSRANQTSRPQRPFALGAHGRPAEHVAPQREGGVPRGVRRRPSASEPSDHPGPEPAPPGRLRPTPAGTGRPRSGNAHRVDGKSLVAPVVAQVPGHGGDGTAQRRSMAPAPDRPGRTVAAGIPTAGRGGRSAGGSSQGAFPARGAPARRPEGVFGGPAGWSVRRARRPVEAVWAMLGSCAPRWFPDTVRPR